MENIEKIDLKHKHYYYAYFYVASLLFLIIGFEQPYTIEYKLSNVLIWSIIILLIPDLTLKVCGVYLWLKEKFDERSS